MTPAHVDCPACARCGLRVAISRHDDGTPLPSPKLRCPACGALWTASDADRAQAERADAADDVRLAVERLRDVAAERGLDGTLRIDVPLVLDALAAAQRSAAQSAAAAGDATRDLGHVVAAERARADAAEGECERLRAALSDIGVAVLMGPGATPEQCIGAAGGMFRNWRDADAIASERLGAVLAANRERREAIADRDAAVAQREALAGAVRVAVEHERAVTQRERYELGCGWFGDLADVPEVAEARAVTDALLTEGTR